MGKKISIGTTLTLIIMAIAITIPLTTVFALKNFNKRVSSITERENMFEKFTEIDNYVRQNRNSDLDESNLMDSVAIGYLSGLDDPYALYMDADTYASYIAASSSTVAGVGITASMDSDGYMLVEKVIDSSTAAVAGILPGDIIIKVDDIKLSSNTYAEAEALLIGDAGTKVTLVVRHDGEDTEMEITRRVLAQSTISSSAFGKCGYIRIDSFNEGVADQFIKAMDKSVSDGSKAIIVDVRNVKGGQMSCAADILGKLVSAGDLLYVEYQNGSSEMLYTSNSRETNVPMVVLVNEGTADAAEFFAASLRDFGKAKLVGTQTAGIGSLQKTYKLNDGSAIQLTIGKYFLASSDTAWEGSGVTPDHVVAINFSLDLSDISTLDSSLDTQLSKAIEVASSSIVEEAPENTENVEENNG